MCAVQYLRMHVGSSAATRGWGAGFAKETARSNGFCLCGSTSYLCWVGWIFLHTDLLLHIYFLTPGNHQTFKISSDTMQHRLRFGKKIQRFSLELVPGPQCRIPQGEGMPGPRLSLTHPWGVERGGFLPAASQLMRHGAPGN
eukprot:EG_transcript_3566